MARRKKSTKEIIEQGLMKLAMGDVSDAVSLLYLSDDLVGACMTKPVQRKYLERSVDHAVLP